MLSRRYTLLIAHCSLLPLALAAKPHRNIIYIMCDDMGYGDLGCYGQKYISTPCIDRMAEEGMRFTQAYASCPVSAPSRCSFMTGQHTGHAKIRGNREYWGRSALRQNMFGENADYPDTYARLPDGNTDTSRSRESSSCSLPNLRGIDCFYGPVCQFQAHTYYPNFLNRYDPEGRGDTHLVAEIMEENINHPGINTGLAGYEERNQYSADLIHQYALEWLDRQTKNEPFLGIFTYTLPHAELWQPATAFLSTTTGSSLPTRSVPIAPMRAAGITAETTSTHSSQP